MPEVETETPPMLPPAWERVSLAWASAFLSSAADCGVLVLGSSVSDSFQEGTLSAGLPVIEPMTL